MRLPFTQWRLLLLAAFVLLAGAMGGGSHPAAAQAASGCHDGQGCDQYLTAPAQPALIQAALRIDGKAMAGGDGNATILPGTIGPNSFALPVRAGLNPDPVTRPRKAANGPGQPRGPPAFA
ncbi:hypothetical protein [Niveispirillum sp. KHB5.9]|uniref:hypothetical protein n=1 Tax=Niveispirillum sp. KHB5.9 TaxID=3400269 RepID=UPI003A8A3D7A